MNRTARSLFDNLNNSKNNNSNKNNSNNNNQMGVHSPPPMSVHSPQQRRAVDQTVRQNVSRRMNGAEPIVKAKVNELLTHLVGLKEILDDQFIVGGSMAVILYILTNRSLPANLLNMIVRCTTDVDLYIKDAGILRRVGPISTYEPFQSRQFNRTKKIDTENYGKVDLTYISNNKFDNMQTVDVEIVGHTFRVIAPNVLLKTYENHHPICKYCTNNIFNANKRKRSNTKIKILENM